MKKSLLVLLMFLSLIVAAGCSEEIQCNLPEYYESGTLPITVKHTKNWKAYEFKENRLAIDYLGVNNFDRRYDAEIIVTLHQLNISESDYVMMPVRLLEAASEHAKNTIGMEITHQSEIVKSQVSFANKTWTVLTSEVNGKHEGELYHWNRSHYLWYSDAQQIQVTINVTGEEIPEIENELQCVLRNIGFTE